MIDLKKEIEERLENAKNDYSEYPVLSTNDITLGKCKAYQDCLDVFKDYNIITAPKTIKLSEIVDRLNEKLILETDYKASVIRYGKDIFIVVKKPFRTFDGVIAEINSTNKIVKIDEKYVIENCKWLYALWLTGTIIEDDLKEE